MAEVSQQLATARLDDQTILKRVTSTLSRRSPGTWMATLMKRDPSTSRVVAADDARPEVADYITELVTALDRPGQVPTSGLSARVIETGTPVFMPRVAFDDLLSSLMSSTVSYFRNNPPPDAMSRGPIGVLIVPMRSRGATIGTLGVLTRQETGPLSAEYLKWMQEIADRIGVAIENAQLFTAGVVRLARLQALQEAGLAVLAAEDLHLTLQIILDVLCTSLGVDAADVALADPPSGTFLIAATKGFHSTMASDFRFPIDPALSDVALRGRRRLSMEELESLGTHRRRYLFAREGFQSYFGMPLVTRNKLKGMLEIFNRSLLEPDEEWLSFVEAIATVTAIAVDYAVISGARQDNEAASLVKKIRQPAPPLSSGDRAILSLLVEGLSNQAIGEQLHISESTVKFHVRRILQRSGVENRTELARKATREGWI